LKQFVPDVFCALVGQYSPPDKKGGPIEAHSHFSTQLWKCRPGSPPDKKGGPIEADQSPLKEAEDFCSPPDKKGGPIEANARCNLFCERVQLSAP
tara:strand:- start:121 stop:405 length:285 start_codon:yes stop_codon:yes gene_type:complete